MRTPDSDRSSRTHRMFLSMCRLLVLACLLAVMPAAAAPPGSPAQDNPTAPGVPPLGQYLNPDGSLALPAGQAVSLDPRGYRLVSGPGEAPRFAPAQPDENPGDENWASDLFTIPGTDGAVYALAIDANGQVYVGGSFLIAGNVVVHNIAKWDGNAWSALGSGTNGPILALAVDAVGNLYAGGSFTTAGAVSANYIAKWNGSIWSSLGSGVGGWVSAVVVDDVGDLYVGGGFLTAGSVNANHIAKWDGLTWSPLGSGIGDDAVITLASDKVGNLYAGGEFTIAGGNTANCIAKWNGTSWSPLGSGMNGPVHALAVDADGDLFAGGYFTTAGGIDANFIAKWDGNSWSGLASGMSNWVRALAVDADHNLYAGGIFTEAGGSTTNHIARWDGMTWSALGRGLGAEGEGVNALAVSAIANLYAGGMFGEAGEMGVDQIAEWRDNNWSVLGSGLNSNVSTLLTDAAGNLYAGGCFIAAGDSHARYVAKWDGTAWTALGDGLDGCVFALATDAAGHLYVGGDFTTAGEVSANCIAKWDGNNWSSLGSGMEWGGSSPCVGALAIDIEGNVYAGGDFYSAGGVNARRIAKWDGTSWSPLDEGIGGGGLYALALDANGTLYAGGDFWLAGGSSANNIAQWDGLTWSPLGTGMGGGGPGRPSVRELVVDSTGTLYASGGFTTAGGVSANHIAKWDGTAWSALGSGTNGAVHALAVDRAGNLYAGGGFTTAGAASTNHIAQWTGTAWHSLGNGMSGCASSYLCIYALVTDTAGNLYAGGNFSMAGYHVSAFLARWTAADGVRGVTMGSYTLYANNLPVTIDVVTPGTLDRLALQRFNRSHPQATPSLATGYYWEIAGTDASGNPATGYVVDLTLPTTFTPGANDRVCRYTGSAWDCAASAFTANSITRTGITQLSDWAVQDNVACADFDGDGTVDIDDLIAIATRWGQTSGTPGWDGRFDLRPDGRIDIVDINLATAQWEQGCSLF